MKNLFKEQEFCLHAIFFKIRFLIIFLRTWLISISGIDYFMNFSKTKIWIRRTGFQGPKRELLIFLFYGSKRGFLFVSRIKSGFLVNFSRTKTRIL